MLCYNLSQTNKRPGTVYHHRAEADACKEKGFLRGATQIVANRPFFAQAGRALTVSEIVCGCEMRDGERRCAECKEWYPVENFRANKASPDGLHWLCEGCLAEGEEFFAELSDSYDAAWMRNWSARDPEAWQRRGRR